ncbi:diflavin flavoprotein [Synechococcus sp. Nb3U1]|uniref:diflavin flavoprotein n=1 Tax=Synechococcus sp. Nb3U1 TaxID=1914529 RepID=UPI001F455E55|nr:diflavin flavoprotein [Synechococcus sp. Nb3U1]MCF2972778.1 diflavin flavoprotein [Synechococcus sp. Nb3U1]
MKSKTPSRDVQVASIGPSTLALRSRTWDRLKFEIEYARQRGTTANSYLIQADQAILIDPPGESFTEIFLEELAQHHYLQKLQFILLSHVNFNRIATLKALLPLAPYAVVLCSKPGVITLRAAFETDPLPTLPARDEEEAADLGITYNGDQSFRLRVVRDGECLDLGEGHELHFRTVPTPRHPDALCTYDPASGILYSDKLFGVHVCDEYLFDEHWRHLSEDRRYYFDCLHRLQAPQVKAALAKLVDFPASTYAPAHGPLVRHSLRRLTLDYQAWCEENPATEQRVALLFTSAYGNTGLMAAAIGQGLERAGVIVERVNCEWVTPEEIGQILERCQGFIIGSPTLAGHAPVQIQTALGIILSSTPNTKVAGVFGSYGWSGEAVDFIESKLLNAGFPLGFETIRAKFKPTSEVLQTCEQAGSQFAQALRKAIRARAPRQTSSETQVARAEQALSRVVGSLCVVTAQQGGIRRGFLTSSVAQASFNPPGLTISVSKDQEAELLTQPQAPFVLNILREGKSSLQRHFQRPQRPGEDRFAGIETIPAENGCPILQEALAYLECRVKTWMDCGDRYIIYAEVERGKVLDPTGVTAMHHRRL